MTEEKEEKEETANYFFTLELEVGTFAIRDSIVSLLSNSSHPPPTLVLGWLANLALTIFQSQLIS